MFSKVLSIIFYINPPSGSRADTGGQTDVTNVIDDFRDHTRGYTSAS